MEKLLVSADKIYDRIAGIFSEDEEIRELLGNQADLESFLNRHKSLMIDYIQAVHRGDRIDETPFRQFYSELSLPYAIIVKYFNLYKTALKKSLLDKEGHEQRAQIVLELDQIFKSHIDLLSKSYIQKECRDYSDNDLHSKFEHFPLYHIHALWIDRIIQTTMQERMDKFPYGSAESCDYSSVMHYPQSLMVCLDSSLCGQLDSTHRTLHDSANIFYRYYIKGEFTEAYFVFKNLLENSHKFFSLLKDLYYLTYSDLENSFFKLIETYTYRDVNQTVSVLDIVDIKRLNSIHGEQKVDVILEDLQKSLENLSDDNPDKLLIIRGVSANFYILHLNEEPTRVIDDIDQICQVVKNRLHSAHPDIKVRFSLASFHLDKKIKYGKDELVRILLHLKDRSKKEHRRIYIFDESESQEIREWLNKRYFNMHFIKKKLQEGAVDVMYQPIFKTEDRKIYALEALARIVDRGKYLPAGLFIETVYEMDMITHLDTMVLDAIEEDMPILRAYTDRIFINASPQSLQDKRYLRRLREFLDRSDEVNIVVEITEQQALENISTLQNCYEKGAVNFAIDDFGSGYSALKIVSRLVEKGLVRFLKIDGTLILDIDTKPQSEKIVKVINEMCQTFNILSIAEFVESESTFDKLAKMGTDLAQGYYLSIPLLAEELHTL